MASHPEWRHNGEATMHVVILIAVIVLIALLFANLRPRRDAAADLGTSSPADGSAAYPVAFISRGKLFHQAPGQPLREIQSPYVQGVLDRMERSRQLHGW